LSRRSAGSPSSTTYSVSTVRLASDLRARSSCRCASSSGSGGAGTGCGSGTVPAGASGPASAGGTSSAADSAEPGASGYAGPRAEAPAPPHPIRRNRRRSPSFGTYPPLRCPLAGKGRNPTPGRLSRYRGIVVPMSLLDGDV
jgi:hypothetical protein